MPRNRTLNFQALISYVNVYPNYHTMVAYKTFILMQLEM